MKLKQRIRQLVPAPLAKALLVRREKGKLRAIQKLACDAANLMPASDVDLKEVFCSSELETRWRDSQGRLDVFAIPDLTGGVNPGDRRAIYTLISRFKPSSVLEVGTHIGASTVHIAEALHGNQQQNDRPVALVTVDFADVNNPVSKPWLRYGTTRSPLEMTNEMGFGGFVEFVKSTSFDYFATCGRTFDFIFLDGDHTSSTVYQEIPSALKLLHPGGLILLHDYFPDMSPLWSNGSMLPGPFLATQRFAEEQANIEVLPLGDLPWPTKFQSNTTSLALLLRSR